ncbi:MAG: glucodextranase DOMON-like domain-containing protein [Anaerolineaceae bacterium]|jgi:alpha-amylase/alpha-mannosidase (GH57 family)
MKTPLRLLSLTILLVLILGMVAACVPAAQTSAPDQLPAETTQPPVSTAAGETAAAPVETQSPAPTIEMVEDPLYINITWHQHQPMYYKDEAGIYTRPWVRVHATKDYLDMVEVIAQYPGVKATINITPSLIKQLDDLSSGAKDLYWVLAEKDAKDLTDDEKVFILSRFYDANWDHIIEVYPRYKALLDKRGGTDEKAITEAAANFTEQDFRDLQVWFNLAWVDPDYLAQEPFKALVAKGENFSEEDKVSLFEGILELVQKVIPAHKALQEQGVIEVTTTPYAHPILPLIYDTDLALVGNPKAIMPQERFSYPEDAQYHLSKSVEMYEEHFGQGVRGLWPGEGSVSEEIIDMVSDAGYSFMQTGEPVLAKSLGMKTDRFARDAQEVVTDPDVLYRPYYVKGENGKPVAIFFRDWNLSDKIGFTYSGMSGKAAAEDLISRFEAVRTALKEKGAQGPHILTIVVDGENAWENYDNDGKEFFHSLYGMLAESKTLKTITPSEYLELFPEQREIEDLFPGAWFSANYDTWIGEAEEAMGWDLLGLVRKDLAEFAADSTLDPEKLAMAWDFMYLAEGSDWFWWYGTDQDSGQDSYFDDGFRALLKGVYTSLDKEYPAFLDIPVVVARPQKAVPEAGGNATPVIDGVVDAEEWKNGAVYKGRISDPFWNYGYIFDDNSLYLNFDLRKEWKDVGTVEVYLGASAGMDRTMQSLNGVGLNAPVNLLIRLQASANSPSIYQFKEGAWQETAPSTGKLAYNEKERTLEVQVPITVLGELKSGDAFQTSVLFGPDNQLHPVDAPGEIRYIRYGPVTEILNVVDPTGDDFGPGTYTYPKDTVFNPSAFDITNFNVSSDENNLIFSFSIAGEITNGWNSPNGFSVQTMDVYIDKDPGQSTGERAFLPGRNAALAKENGWDIALWIEGWTPQLVRPDPDNPGLPMSDSEASSAMRLFIDPGKNAIVASIPMEYFGEGNPADWSYAAAMLSQEGYPAEGIWRVRDVFPTAEQYKIGGGKGDTNGTRIIDLVVPEGQTPDQAEILSAYTSSNKAFKDLTADDFAIIPLFAVK